MPSKLDIDVRNAKALGLSYGYYKALYPNTEETSVKDMTNVKICPICGGIVKPPKIKVCSDECADIRRKQREKGRKK